MTVYKLKRVFLCSCFVRTTRILKTSATGKYKDTTGSDAESDCVPCAEGTYSTQKAAVSFYDCRRCPNGTISAAGSDEICDCVGVPCSENQSASGMHVSVEMTITGFNSKNDLLSFGVIFRTGVAYTLNNMDANFSFCFDDVVFKKICDGNNCSKISERRAGTDLLIAFGVSVKEGTDPQSLIRSLSSDSWLLSFLAYLSAATGRTITGQLTKLPILERAELPSVSTNVSTNTWSTASPPNTTPPADKKTPIQMTDVYTVDTVAGWGMQETITLSVGIFFFVLSCYSTWHCFLQRRYCWSKVSSPLEVDCDVKKMALAFMMTQHKRLGEASTARDLDDRVARLILQFALSLPPSKQYSQNDSSAHQSSESEYSHESSELQSSDADMYSDSLLDSEGVQRRREHLLQMMRMERERRREEGDEVSSSDDDRDIRRMDAQLLGMTNQLIKDNHHKQSLARDLESVFLDPEGVQKRLEVLLRIMREDRRRRQEEGEEASSSNDERDMRRVDAQLFGMARTLRKTNRRTRSENKGLESLFLDPEGVQRRRELLLGMMKQDRRRRQEEGDRVSSSDDDRDMRRVDVQIVEMDNQQNKVKRHNLSRTRGLKSVFLDPDCFQRRREYLLRMLREDRRRRREEGDEASSSDDERDMRRVAAQLFGMARTLRKANRRTRAENKDLESIFLDPEGVQRRREFLLQMLKQDRSRRREEGDRVSSSDDERDKRRVDAQIQGMAKLPNQSTHRTRAENKDLESLFLDPEGVQRRREFLLEMMKQDRRRRQGEWKEVSSSDDERDMRRVDAQIQGMAGLPNKSNRRTRAENKDLESLFLDPEGVQRRREFLLQMLKQDRSRRQEEGNEASSSDDERDMRRVDAQLVGVCRLDKAGKGKTRKHHPQDIDNILFSDLAPRRHPGLLKQDKLMSVSLNSQEVKYTESFNVHGNAKFQAQTTSRDPRLIKEIERQKQNLKQAGLCATFMGENGAEELETVTNVTRTMRNLWKLMSIKNVGGHLPLVSPWSASRSASGIDSGAGTRYLDDIGDIEAELVVQNRNDWQVRPLNTSGDSELHIYKGLHGLSKVESEANKTLAPKMRKFWRRVEEEKMKLAQLKIEDVTFSVEVGIDENFKGASSQSVNPNWAPQLACQPQHDGRGREGARALSFKSLQTPNQSKLWAGSGLPSTVKQNQKVDLVGRSTTTDSKMARELQAQMELLRTHLSLEDLTTLSTPTSALPNADLTHASSTLDSTFLPSPQPARLNSPDIFSPEEDGVQEPTQT